MLHDVFTLSNLCRYHPLVEAIKQLPKPWRVVKWSRRSTSATTGWDCWRFKVDGNSPDALWLSQFDSAASVQTPCRWIKGTILTVNTGSGRSCRPAYLKPSLTRPTLFLAKPTAISFFPTLWSGQSCCGLSWASGLTAKLRDSKHLRKCSLKCL